MCARSVLEALGKALGYLFISLASNSGAFLNARPLLLAAWQVVLIR
jgi:hypothetical protein